MKVPLAIGTITAVLITFIFNLKSVVYGRICPGFCSNNSTLCELHSGEIIGYCKNSKPCCKTYELDDNKEQDDQHFDKNKFKHIGTIGKCGYYLRRINNNEIVIFQSPNYPKYGSGDLNCEFKLELNKDTTAIRIDFNVFDMDDMKYGPENKACDSDLLFIKGFEGWTPPSLCGNLTGYSTLIDKTDPRAADMSVLSFVALMSTEKWKWNIEITPLGKVKNKTTRTVAKNTVRSTKKTGTNLRSKFNKPKYENKSKKGEMSFRTHLSPPLSIEDLHNKGPAELSSNANTANNEFNSRNMPDFQLETSFITSGNNTLITQVPWQVSLRSSYSSYVEKYGKSLMEETSIQDKCNYTSEGFHFCGGSIIGPKYILTAAHCFFGTTKTEGAKPLSEIIVVVGDTNKCEPDDDENEANSRPRVSIHEVERIIFHYGYDPSVIINDVVLLKLKTEIMTATEIEDGDTENIPAAQIIELAEEGANFAGQIALASGWGRTNLTDQNNFTPSILQSNNNFIVLNKDVCGWYLSQSMFGVTVDKLKEHKRYSQTVESIICTKGSIWGNYNSKDDGLNSTSNSDSSSSTSRNTSAVKNGTLPALTGEGDSGGPLVAFIENESGITRPILIGIVSYATQPMNSTFMDFFQSVSFYRNWIITAMDQI